MHPHPLVDTTPGKFVDTLGTGIIPRELATAADEAVDEQEARSSASSIDLPDDARASADDASDCSSSFASQVAASQPYPPRKPDAPPKDSYIYCADVNCEC